jgi:hypothetical protein
MQILFVESEVEDGVTDQLTRAVIGYISAALDLVDLYALLPEGCRRRDDVGFAGAATFARARSRCSWRASLYSVKPSSQISLQTR